MTLFLHILLSVLLAGLFLYSKLSPHKDRLNPKYRRIYNSFHSIFHPVLNLLKSVIKPFNVGQGLAVDMTQIVLFIVLLILLQLF